MELTLASSGVTNPSLALIGSGHADLYRFGTTPRFHWADGAGPGEIAIVEAAVERRSRPDMSGATGWSSEKGSDWQFVPPGSLADGLMDIACSGHTAPNKTTIVIPDAPQLSPELVHTAVAAYARVQSQSGAMGAVAFITDCFAKLPPSPAWSKVDFCTAFDAAAGMLDASYSVAAKIPPTDFLSRPNRLRRAFKVIDKMNPDRSVYAIRMNTLERIVPDELDKAF